MLSTNMEARTDGRVRLLCEEEPHAIQVSNYSKIEFNFMPAELNGGVVPMICRVEVSGQQIKKGNPNPICVYLLDSEGKPEGKQWCSHIEFPTAVFGNRDADTVWLETHYDFNVGITREDA